MDPTTLRDILRRASHVQKLRDGDFAPYFSSPFATMSQRFTIDDLDAVDARLPDVVDTELTRLHPDEAHMMVGSVLAAALRSWEEPVLVELPLEGSAYGNCTMHPVMGVYSIVRKVPGYAVLHIDRPWFSTTPSGITYARSISEEKLVLETAYMDKHFPDWEKRFAVANSLELSPHEKGNMVFSTPSPLVSVDISEVTFE